MKMSRRELSIDVILWVIDKGIGGSGPLGSVRISVVRFRDSVKFKRV